jgi:prepilin-type N-terminal cleavage/methylation domain-containing protein
MASRAPSGSLLRRAPARARLRGDDGFSLLEMITVLSIISILIVISSVGLLSYKRSQALSGAANVMLTDLRDAQVRAQAEVRTYKVIFDGANEAYEVCRLTSAGVYESVERIALPAGIDLDTVSYGSGTAGACTAAPPCPCAFFEPRGVVTDQTGNVVDGSVKLRSTKLNQDRDIVVKGLTSRAEMN